MTICPTCKKWPRASPGAKCRDCHNVWQRNYNKTHPYNRTTKHKAKLRAIIQKAKSVPCTDCKTTYHPFVMDFDHVRGEKKFNLALGANTGRAVQTILDEIAKCDIVCSNCHRLRTLARKSGAQFESAGQDQS